MEQIINIEEVFNYNPDADIEERYDDGYQGFHLETTQHDYYILVDNCVGCCESFGHIATPDDVKQFIGHPLHSVTFKTDPTNDSDGGTCFIDINTTDIGPLQLNVYNRHNGYYGHQIVFIKDNQVLEDFIL